MAFAIGINKSERNAQILWSADVMQPDMTHFVELKIDAVSQLHITSCLDFKLVYSL